MLQGLLALVVCGAPDVSLVVELDLPPGELADELRDSIRAQSEKVLSDAGVQVSPGVARQVRVEVYRYGDGGIHYGGLVSVYEEAVVAVQRPFKCELCKESEMLAKVDVELSRVSGWLMRAPVSASTDSVDEPVEPEPTHQIAKPEKKIRRIGGLGIAGAVLSAAGVAAIAPGVAFIVQGDQQRFGERGLAMRRSRRSVGVGLTAVGSIAVALGVPMLIYDVAHRARRRTRGAVAFVNVAREFASVGISGRF